MQNYQLNTKQLQVIHQNINLCEAASTGDLIGLMDQHLNGSWNSEVVCLSAVMFGHLDCLKYAHENGCPWDNRFANDNNDAGNQVQQSVKNNYDNNEDEIQGVNGFRGDAGIQGHRGPQRVKNNNNENVCVMNRLVDCMQYAYDNGFTFTKKELDYGYITV